MVELLQTVVSWQTLIVVLVIYGIAPGVALRLIVLAFERDDPRRAEMLAELRVVPRHLRPIWVAEQLEVAVFEGLFERASRWADRMIIHRFRLRSGVAQHEISPNTFWIPSEAEKDAVRPGDLVKLMWEVRGLPGERMWVHVTQVKGDRLEGQLSNTPVFVGLDPGARVKFKREHIIDIDVTCECMEDDRDTV